MRAQTDGAWKNWLVTGIAALLLLGLTGYVLHVFRQGNAQPLAADLQQLRTLLLAAPASTQGNWLRTLNPQVRDVEGDLVWNSERQQGVLRIANLPQPRAGSLYRLWLYDTHSLDGTPVPGAVLEQGAGRDSVLVPIQTATQVVDPYKFVLTEEPDTQGSRPAGKVLLMVQP